MKGEIFMKKISKILSLALIAILLLSMTLTSCGLLGGILGGSDKNDESDSKTSSDVQESESETEKGLADLDVVDLGGRKFTMLWPEYISNEGHFKYSELGIDSSSSSQGDLIENAIYRRNEIVKSAYNADIEVTVIKYSEIVNFVRNEYTTGTTSYDVIATMIAKMSTLAIEGVLSDYNDFEYYDEEQQWWNHDLMQSFSIVNKKYFGTGDIIYSDDLYPYVIYANTGLADTVGIHDNFYQLVADKEWTLEKFHNLAKEAVLDQDGDGVAANSLEDRFGAVDGKSFARAMYYSAGKGVISFDEQGYPVWEMEVAYADMILSKILDIWHSDNAIVDVAQYNGGKTLPAMDIMNMFNSDQMLFMPGDLKAAQAFTSLDNALEDYALLPIPLWDEDSDYVCVLNDSVVVSVPAMALEQDEISLLLSAMGRESISTLTPAFFEIVLTDRYMKNAQSVATLELILNSVVPKDIADIQGWGGFMNQFCSLAVNNKTDFSSYYAENISKARAEMDSYISQLENIDR